MNYGGLLPTGMLLLLFARSTRSLVRTEPTAAVGSVLLHFFAIGVFVAGLVRCDAGCPIATGSLPNLLHGFGLWRRLLLATVFVWCMMVALHIRRRGVDSTKLPGRTGGHAPS